MKDEKKQQENDDIKNEFNKKFNEIPEGETIEFIVEEQKELEEGKSKSKKQKPETPRTIAYWGLTKSIGWIFIIILSITFGSLAIRDFVVELEQFIDMVQVGDDGWEATGQFFVVFGYVFEAGLFAFFIIYSIKMAIKTMLVYLKWVRENSPAKIKAKIKDIKSQFEITKNMALYHGIEYKAKVFNGEVGSKDELKFYTKENKKLFKKTKEKKNKKD